MPILEVNGRRVEVGPEFMSLTPQEQEAEVDEIAAGFGQQQPADVTGGFGERSARETIEPETPELRREIDRSKAVAGYEALPWHQKELTDLNDAVRLAASGASFGLADRLAALGGGSFEEEQAKTQAARDRQNWLGTAVEAAGSIASIPAKGLGLVRNLPAMVQGASTATKVGAGATRAGALAAEGAVIGGANALGREKTSIVLLVWAVSLVLLALLLAGVWGQPSGALGPKPALIGAEAITEAGRKAYERSEKAGLLVKPQWTDDLAQDVADGLKEWGWRPGLGKVEPIVREIQSMYGQTVRLKDIDSLRQVAGMLGRSAEPRERFLAGQIIKKIDKHIDRLDMTKVTAGNKTEAVAALKDARRLWSTAKKSEMVDQAVERAQLAAGTSGTGGNIDNALRQQFKNILNSPKKSRGFSADEKAAMRQIALGTNTQNALRLLGRLSPSTGGLSLMLHGGAAYGTGGASVAAGAVGYGAKTAADRLTKNNIYGLARLIRQNGLTPNLQAQIKKMPRARQQRLARVLQGWGVGGAEVPE